MRLKRWALLVVTLLVVVPGVARAHQKLERRPDLKPTASFRDVDRPPEQHLEPAAVRLATFCFSPTLTPIADVEEFNQAVPHLPRSIRPTAPRAPPAV